MATHYVRFRSEALARNGEFYIHLPVPADRHFLFQYVLAGHAVAGGGRCFRRIPFAAFHPVPLVPSPSPL